jgi:hypothetical protein
MRQVRTQQSRLAPALFLISFRLTSLRQGYGGPPVCHCGWKAEATRAEDERDQADGDQKRPECTEDHERTSNAAGQALQ